MARTKSVIMSKEETKAALAAAKNELKELKATQKTLTAERKTLDKDYNAAAKASDKAVAAGARPASVAIVDFDEVPLPYLPGNATRLRVKAVGDLDMGGAR